MKGFKKTILASTALLFVFGLSVQNAAAVPMLKLSDGTTTITIADGDALDESDVAGIVSAQGSLGVFMFDLAVGTTKPAIGSASDPQMHITQMLLTSSGAGTFTIEFTETDFSALAPVAFNSFLGGAGDGTRTFTTYFDAANGEFAKTTPLADLGPVGASVGLSASSSLLGPDTAFSLTAVAVITHTGAGGATSLDANINAVPEPGTMLLMGSGLLGLGLWRKLKK